MELRKKTLWFTEQITRLSFWTFLLAMGYGICLWTRNCIRNPGFSIHVKLAIVSGIIYLAGLCLIFILDEWEF